jgi:hypothetical protein
MPPQPEPLAIVKDRWQGQEVCFREGGLTAVGCPDMLISDLCSVGISS